MTESLRHRGPDDGGVWLDEAAGLAFGHRRLSILDLSPAGHQPMLSADGRFCIAYNGEVFNHAELRAELEAEGCRFQGHSDTEIILEAMAIWGVEATVKRLIGMFAIALWDRRDRRLVLARDRLGIKPLYWGRFGGLWLFGSELKALRAHPDWTPRLHRPAIAGFLRHNCVPAPLTAYERVFKLEPGWLLTIESEGEGEPVHTRYWDAREVAKAGIADRLQGSDAELADRLEALLKDAVGRRMVADVPVGAFLSGGIDSTVVAALMQAQAPGQVRTFSVGFESGGFDEAPYAAAVARHLGTQHTELYATGQDALDIVPKLAEWFDEPFADSSQIPTYLVSALTRKHVTVALSGDGGDELFAGYNRHRLAARMGPFLSAVPLSLRKWAGSALCRLPAGLDRRLAALPIPQAGDKLRKLGGILSSEDTDAMYRRLVSHWEPGQLMPGTPEPDTVLFDRSLRHEIPDPVERMQFLDLVTYLPDDILTKVDRASMAVALEARVPLLDHRLVEFSWRLPPDVKMRGGTGKWLLRQVLYRHVPKPLMDRPKMGFGVPLAEWLRGPLRDWAENLLDENRLRQAGLLDAATVRRYWAEHLSGARNLEYQLWDILMLEAWRDRWPTEL